MVKKVKKQNSNQQPHYEHACKYLFKVFHDHQVFKFERDILLHFQQMFTSPTKPSDITIDNLAEKVNANRCFKTIPLTVVSLDPEFTAPIEQSTEAKGTFGEEPKNQPAKTSAITVTQLASTVPSK